MAQRSRSTFNQLNTEGTGSNLTLGMHFFFIEGTKCLRSVDEGSDMSVIYCDALYCIIREKFELFLYLPLVQLLIARKDLVSSIGVNFNQLLISHYAVRRLKPWFAQS